MKHAQASNITLLLQMQTDKQVLLEITDNGLGFDINATSKGHGLQSMKERSLKLGGIFEIVSHLHQGTQMRLKVDI
jgi:signal transduction histidine kinase